MQKRFRPIHSLQLHTMLNLKISIVIQSIKQKKLEFAIQILKQPTNILTSKVAHTKPLPEI